jgi:hypothetical protein
MGLGEGAIADLGPGDDIGLGVGDGDDRPEHGAGAQTDHGGPTHPASSRDQRDGADHGQADHQEHRVIQARQQLEQHGAGADDAVAHPAGVEEPVPRPERQRHPLRPLQLQVLEMDAAIGREREHQSGDDRSAAMPGQPDGQQIGEERGRRQPDQDEAVGHGIRPDADGRERDADQALQQDGVGVGQGPAIRPEDIAVEEVAGLPQLMRDPAQPPCREGRIEMCWGQFSEARRQRPCENDT